MRQEINLYQAAFRPKRQPWTLNQLFIAGGVLLVMLVAWAWWEQQKLNSLQAELDVLSARKIQSEEQIVASETKLSSNKINADLVEHISHARLDLKKKQAVLDYFNDLKLTEDRGFSPLLQGLADRQIKGVWLTILSIGKEGQYLQLEGSALDAYLVPAFLAALSKDRAYSGRNFKSMYIKRPEEEAWKIDFTLTTDAQEKSG